MKYRTHYSKTAALEDVTGNAHQPVTPDVIYMAAGKDSVGKPLPSSNDSEEHILNIIGYLLGHGDTQLDTLSTSKAGIGALKSIQKKLDLAGDELLRIEDESGKSLSHMQAEEVEVYAKESQTIQKVLQAAKKMPRVMRRHETGNPNNHCMT